MRYRRAEKDSNESWQKFRTRLFALAAISAFAATASLSSATQSPSSAVTAVRTAIHGVLDRYRVPENMRGLVNTDVTEAICPRSFTIEALSATASAGSFDEIDVDLSSDRTGNTMLAAKGLGLFSTIILRIHLAKDGTCSANVFPSGI